MQENRVIKSESGLFWVQTGDKIINCKARSKLKKDSIIVGDFVVFDQASNECVIDRVLPRKNKLIRPSIANVDQIIIMVAAIPEVDYLLIDKLILNAACQNIDTIICVNKSDIDLNNLQTINDEYQKAVQQIVVSSAIEGAVDDVKKLLSGKLTCIAGQSAVGKSTIINALMGSDKQKTGQLSKKILRGKNTTTASEIFPICGGYVVDTPGFSVVDVFDILPQDISHFYPEFEDHRKTCKFSTCTHTAEPICGVREAVMSGSISQSRYERYRRIYQENKEFYERNPKLKQ